MKKIILIDKSIVWTRISLLIDQQLVASYIDSHLKIDFENKIIVGQVDKVIKNLNAAFIDYGAEKKGLLHLSQIPEIYQKKIQQGMRLPIQVIRTNEGDKGNRLTAKVSLRGKYLICLPFEQGISISKKIKNISTRKTLKENLSSSVSADYGWIIRTHAENINAQQLIEDAEHLITQANRLIKIKDTLSKGSILYEDYPMYIEIIREHIGVEDTLEIICNDLQVKSLIEQVFINCIHDNSFVKLDYKTPQENLYQIYDIQKEITNLQKRKIWLKNGGNIVIDYTEALTVVDVNSAKSILSKDRRKSIYELNLLAIHETILQIYRRNLCGIIILDLVEMPVQEDREKVYFYAKKLIHEIGDQKTKVFPLTELGLLQFSRTKKYSSIPEILFKKLTCSEHLPKDWSMLYHTHLIEQQVRYTAFHTTNKKLDVSCSKDLLDFFKNNTIKSIFEENYGISIHLIKQE